MLGDLILLKLWPLISGQKINYCKGLSTRGGTGPFSALGEGRHSLRIAGDARYVPVSPVGVNGEHHDLGYRPLKREGSGCYLWRMPPSPRASHETASSFIKATPRGLEIAQPEPSMGETMKELLKKLRGARIIARGSEDGREII